MPLRADLSKLRRRPWPDQALALEALAWLAVMRLAIRLLPFPRLVAWLRLEPGETSAQPAPPAAQAVAGRIGWAVRAAAARTPWESACLVQALAAARMLQRRRLSSTLYLGAARKPGQPDQLHAHAWLRCGSLILTGESESRHFPVLTSFRAKPPQP